MKRIVSLLLVVFAFYVSSAQENWLFMPTWGVNLTPVDVGSVNGTLIKPGALVGFMASNELEEHWSFDYGIIINQRYSGYTIYEESSQLADILDVGNIPILSDFDYTIYKNTTALTQFWTIDAPISVTYKFNTGFLLFGGGFFNYLMAANTDLEEVTHIPVFETVDPETLPIDQNLLAFLPRNGTKTSGNSLKEGMNDFNYGLIFGLGYQSEKWTCKIGYHWGLNDMRDDLDVVDMNIKKQRAFTLTLAYNVRDLFETSKQKPKYDLELIE